MGSRYKKITNQSMKISLYGRVNVLCLLTIPNAQLHSFLENPYQEETEIIYLTYMYSFIIFTLLYKQITYQHTRSLFFVHLNNQNHSKISQILSTMFS